MPEVRPEGAERLRRLAADDPEAFFDDLRDTAHFCPNGLRWRDYPDVLCSLCRRGMEPKAGRDRIAQIEVREERTPNREAAVERLCRDALDAAEVLDDPEAAQELRDAVAAVRGREESEGG